MYQILFEAEMPPEQGEMDPNMMEPQVDPLELLNNEYIKKLIDNNIEELIIKLDAILSSIKNVNSNIYSDFKNIKIFLSLFQDKLEELDPQSSQELLAMMQQNIYQKIKEAYESDNNPDNNG